MATPFDPYKQTSPLMYVPQYAERMMYWDTDNFFSQGNRSAYRQRDVYAPQRMMGDVAMRGGPSLGGASSINASRNYDAPARTDMPELDSFVRGVDTIRRGLFMDRSAPQGKGNKKARAKQLDDDASLVGYLRRKRQAKRQGGSSSGPNAGGSGQGGGSGGGGPAGPPPMPGAPGGPTGLPNPMRSPRQYGPTPPSGPAPKRGRAAKAHRQQQQSVDDYWNQMDAQRQAMMDRTQDALNNNTPGTPGVPDNPFGPRASIPMDVVDRLLNTSTVDNTPRALGDNPLRPSVPLRTTKTPVINSVGDFTDDAGVGDPDFGPTGPSVRTVSPLDPAGVAARNRELQADFEQRGIERFVREGTPPPGYTSDSFKVRFINPNSKRYGKDFEMEYIEGSDDLSDEYRSSVREAYQRRYPGRKPLVYDDTTSSSRGNRVVRNAPQITSKEGSTVRVSRKGNDSQAPTQEQPTQEQPTQEQPTQEQPTQEQPRSAKKVRPSGIGKQGMKSIRQNLKEASEQAQRLNEENM